MNQSARTTMLFAAIFGGIAVVIGAFGAHGLKPLLNDYQILIFEKGVQYQFYHSFALGLTALMQNMLDDARRLNIARWLFTAGIICFSGSLYLLACRDLLPMSVAWAGPITPLGGLGFIGGWGLLAMSAARRG
ncbi:MAG: DUF423 domain-containing protein [Bacteroidota bacterium]